MVNFQLLLIGFLSIIILILIYRILIKKKLYFTSSYFEENIYDINENDLENKILNALKKSNFKKIDKSENEYSAISLPSMSSFSEKIKVKTIKISDGKFNVEFFSKCFFPLQIFDWGKNKRNSDCFFKHLKHKL